MRRYQRELKIETDISWDSYHLVGKLGHITENIDNNVRGLVQSLKSMLHFLMVKTLFTASISQCFMTKHCKNIEERDTLLFTILFNKKDKYHTALFLSFLCQDMI